MKDPTSHGAIEPAVVPISGIKTRNGFRKVTYSDRGLPKIVIGFSLRFRPAITSFWRVPFRTRALGRSRRWERNPRARIAGELRSRLRPLRRADWGCAW